MKKILDYCFLLLLILALPACRMRKDLVYEGVQNFSLRGNGVSMDLQLYNPNSYKLKLKHADVEIYLNGSHLGKMTENKPMTIVKRDTFLMPVLLNVDLKNALPNMLQLLFSEDVHIKLTGYIKAGRHGVFVTVPVHYEGRQDIRAGIK